MEFLERVRGMESLPYKNLLIWSVNVIKGTQEKYVREVIRRKKLFFSFCLIGFSVVGYWINGK